MATRVITARRRRPADVSRANRKEIQALRAAAVLLVAVHHLWPGTLTGGFVGVDVFFVISGFLITSLLVRELDRTGRVSLSGFWARRARRILPAAITTLLFCAFATVAVVPMTAWGQSFGEIRDSAAYVENWHLSAAAVDYFAAGNDPSAVQHYWSLSVEEQFYLLWPLLLVLMAAAARACRIGLRRGVLVAGLLALTLASLAYSALATKANPAATYFVTPARAWEFGLGGLLALLPVLGEARSATRSALSWLGLIAIGVAAATYSARTEFPGLAALLPVLGACAVITAGAPRRRWAPTPLLSLRPVQYVGDISYSVYLWHWPLLIFIPYAVGRPLDTRIAIVVLVATLLVASATKLLVEDPVRRGAFLVRRRAGWTFGFAAIGTLLVIAVALSGSWWVQREIDKDAQASQRVIASKPRCFGAAAHDARRPCRNPALRLTVVPTPLEATKYVPPCRFLFNIVGKKVCAFGVPAARATATVALIGDSHAEHWRPALEVVARAHRWRGIHLGHASCPLSLATRAIPEPDRSHCTRWRKAVLGWLDRHPEISTVFVSGVAGGTGVLPERGRSETATEVDGYIRAWRALPDSVRHVVVIRDTPRVHGYTDECIEKAMRARRAAGPACSVPRRDALSKDEAVVAAARPGTARAVSVDLTRFFCGARSCLPVVGGVLVYHDQNHMTPVFARSLGPYLLRAVDAELGPTMQG